MKRYTSTEVMYMKIKEGFRFMNLTEEVVTKTYTNPDIISNKLE